MRCIRKLIVLSLIYLLIGTKAMRRYDVIVVGGGMAGLSAAEQLVKHNITNIAVFEAKDRIGGRVHTKQMNSGPAEMGAQWIHGGTVLNSVYMYANSKRLVGEVNCQSEKGPVILRGGTLVDANLAERVFKDIEKTESRFEFRNISYESYLNHQFGLLLKTYSPKEKPIVKQLMNSYKLSRMFDDGDDLRLSATRIDYFQYPCDIDINGGNNQLTQSLKRDIGSGKIFLNREVLNINWEDSEVILTVKHRNSTKKVAANYVICTVSLGVLKNYASTLFTPNIPEKKTDAMSRLIFGRGVKIFLYYKSPFWKRNDLIDMKIGVTDEEYKKSHNEWIHTLCIFMEVSDNPNVLMTVVFGKPASDVELMNNVEIGRQITALLRNYTGDQTLPEPDEVIKSNWIHDRFIHGTYSCPGVNAIGNEQEILSEPINRLHFAGEATIPKFFSTMHGARSSGIREAHRIIAKLKPN